MNGGPLRVTGDAKPGGTITVEVANSATSVELNVLGSSATTSHPVGVDGTVDIRLPNAPPGTVLVLSVGHGVRRHLITIQIEEQPPG